MNKSPQAKKSWTEIEMTIAAAAITGTLAMWNFFAVPAPLEDVEETVLEETAVPQVMEVLPTAMPTPVPQVKILLGGSVPQTSIAPQAQTSSIQPSSNQGGQQPLPPAPKKKKKGGGGGTGTSKP